MDFMSPAIIEKLLETPVLLMVIYFVWVQHKTVIRLIETVNILIQDIEKIVKKD